MTLQMLIDCFTYERNIHICVHDISGILTQINFNLNFENTCHSAPFCSYAKSTKKGYSICVSCKKRAVKKVKNEKEIHVGKCVYGVCEVVQPVVIDGVVMAIIFIGNITNNISAIENRINRIYNILNIPNDGFKETFNYFCVTDNLTPYMIMAKFISGFMIELYNGNLNVPRKSTHWIVPMLIEYIKNNYNKDKDISLRNLSQLYYFDENYIGRIFKKQTGKTFSQYLNGIRLKRSLDLLMNTDNSIIYIASSVGFNNVNYYNRIFRKKFGISPSEYRRKEKY